MLIQLTGQNTASQTKHICRSSPTLRQPKLELRFECQCDLFIRNALINLCADQASTGFCRLPYFTIDSSTPKFSSTWSQLANTTFIAKPTAIGNLLLSIFWVSPHCVIAVLVFSAPDGNPGRRAQRVCFQRKHLPMGKCLTNLMLFSSKVPGSVQTETEMDKTLISFLVLGTLF